MSDQENTVPPSGPTPWEGSSNLTPEPTTPVDVAASPAAPPESETVPAPTAEDIALEAARAEAQQVSEEHDVSFTPPPVTHAYDHHGNIVESDEPEPDEPEPDGDLASSLDDLGLTEAEEKQVYAAMGKVDGTEVFLKDPSAEKDWHFGWVANDAAGKAEYHGRGYRFADPELIANLTVGERQGKTFIRGDTVLMCCPMRIHKGIQRLKFLELAAASPLNKFLAARDKLNAIAGREVAYIVSKQVTNTQHPLSQPIRSLQSEVRAQIDTRSVSG